MTHTKTSSLWHLLFSIPDPTPSTMTALHQFGAEMLKLSRGLQSFSPVNETLDDDDLHKKIEFEEMKTNNSKQHKASNVGW